MAIDLREHTRDLLAWLRSYSPAQQYNTTPPFAAVLQPTVLVDDVRRLGPRIQGSTILLTITRPAQGAGRHSGVMIRSYGGAYVREIRTLTPAAGVVNAVVNQWGAVPGGTNVGIPVSRNANVEGGLGRGAWVGNPTHAGIEQRSVGVPAIHFTPVIAPVDLSPADSAPLLGAGYSTAIGSASSAAYTPIGEIYVPPGMLLSVTNSVANAACDLSLIVEDPSFSTVARPNVI